MVTKKASQARFFQFMELMDGIEPSTSPLPRVCSTPELHERIAQNLVQDTYKQHLHKIYTNSGAGGGNRTRTISLEG